MDVDAYFLRTSLWPAVLFTVLMMIIGTVGNALVLVIYRKDYHKSVTWVFIYYLSALDLLSCLISMPSELTILFNMTSFPSWPWCKASRYLSYVFHGSSCVILMFIAFNRYDRVCRTANQSLSLTKAKKICIGVFVFAAVIDVPSVILYGEKRIPMAVFQDSAKFISDDEMNEYIGLQNSSSAPNIVNGTICMISSEYSGGFLNLIFIVIQFIMYVTLVVLVIYFYTKVINKMIAYRAQQERSFRRCFPTRNSAICEEMSNNPLSGEEKSDTFAKDVTSDPLSESTDKTASLKGTANADKEIVDVHKTNGSRKSNNSPKNDVSSEQTLKERPIVTLPILGDVNPDNNNSSKPSKPVESNKLLSRRIKSVETLSETLISIPSLTLPNTNASKDFENHLFLRASKTHKKRGQYESDKRDLKRKCNSDEEVLITKLDTRDDLYLHKGGSNLHGCLSKSMDLLSPSLDDPLNVSAKTMTLNRRSPKGSSQCVLPISGLSVKTITSYDGTNGSTENLDDPSQSEGNTNNGSPNADVESSANDESPIKPESVVENDNGTTKDTNEIETCSPEFSSAKAGELTSSHSESNPDKETGELSNSECQRRGRHRLSAQQSVTFSIVEGRDEKRPRTRKKLSHLDSASSLFGSPDNLDKSSSFRKRTHTNESLFTPSSKTIGYNRRMSVKPIKALRTSSMLLAISLAFILSFLPFWIIVMWRAVVGASFMFNLNPVTFGLVSFFIRSSLVSNAVNPIVYGLLNSQFRKRCKAIFRRA